MGLRQLMIGALLSLAGCLGDGTCPCGALPSDPLSLHDPTYAGTHDVQAEDECETCDADAGR